MATSDNSFSTIVAGVDRDGPKSSEPADNTDNIRLVLEGQYSDPESNTPVRVSTRSVVIVDTLKGIEADIVRELNVGNSFAVVSDPTTFGVLGKQAEAAVRSIGRVESVVLPGRPNADIDTVAVVRQAAAHSDCLIAVGSGTINDVCKYAAAQDAKPYAVFATAPSMNGYVAENAAITVHGHKRSLAAVAPVGVFMDLQVLANAPKRMIRAGFGDSLCRCTAQADWLMSHLLHGSPYREVPFLLVADDEDGLLAEPEALLSDDMSAMARLARTLILSGFGMAICGSSHPGSQGEHLISHYIDMMQPAGRPAVLHGEQVGVTTLSMARLQEQLLHCEAPQLRQTRVSKSMILAHFGHEIGRDCWQEYAQKRLTARAASQLNELLVERWTEIRNRLLAVTRSASQLEGALRRIGAPLRNDDIYVTRDFYSDAVLRAREIRNRFTFLDLAADSGLLNPDHLL